MELFPLKIGFLEYILFQRKLGVLARRLGANRRLSLYRFACLLLFPMLWHLLQLSRRALAVHSSLQVFLTAILAALCSFLSIHIILGLLSLQNALSIRPLWVPTRSRNILPWFLLALACEALDLPPISRFVSLQSSCPSRLVQCITMRSGGLLPIPRHLIECPLV